MDYDRPCRLLPQAKLDLEWCIQSLPQHNCRNIVPPTAHLVMASLEGWGATCKGTRTGGMWTREERQLPINVLELKVAFLALQVFASRETCIHVLLRIDNTTAIAYLNKRGGTHSQRVSDLAAQVWEWCLTRKITLQAEHIPGRETGERTESRGEERTPTTGCCSQKCSRKSTTDMGTSGHRPLRCSSQLPAAQILQLQAGSSSRGGRCSGPEVVNATPICFPSIHPTGSSIAKGQSPPSSGDSTNMAEPALVSIATGDHDGPTADSSSDPAPVDESSRGTSPLIQQGHLHLASPDKHHQERLF